MADYTSPKQLDALDDVSSTLSDSSLIPAQDVVGNRLGHVTPITIVSLTTIDDIQDGVTFKKLTAAEKVEIATIRSEFDSHVADLNNPHSVDQIDVGLGSVDNTSDLNKPISIDTQDALNLKSDTTHDHNYEPADVQIQDHITNATGNPHVIDKSDVGLGSVDNTSDIDKPVSTDTQASISTKADLGVNSDITSMTGLDDRGIPVAKIAEVAITDTTLSGTPKVFTFYDENGTPYYAKLYPNKI